MMLARVGTTDHPNGMTPQMWSMVMSPTIKTAYGGADGKAQRW